MTRRSLLAERILPALQELGESHGRRLAADLGASPGAVARALARMEERGQLNSRWAGRTRLYRPGGDQLLMAEVCRRLAGVKGIQPLVVLPFGSRAGGAGRADSDHDLLVAADGCGWSDTGWPGPMATSPSSAAK